MKNEVANEAPGKAQAAKPQLLIVDDDPLITDTLAFALGADYEVLAVESRSRAVELVRQLAPVPGLALIDLGLPPTPHSPEEGFRLIADLLAHSPAMKIFVLSGQNEAANARHARALGAWEFIAKPANPLTLKRALDRARGSGIEHPNHRHRRLLRACRERPSRRAAEQRDELAPLYPNHVIPRAYAVWVRLKRTLAALAYFAQCLGRRFLVVGAQHDRSRTRAAVPQLGRGHR